MKTITRNQYLQLVGLITLGKHHRTLLESIEKAAREITGESEEGGSHSDDMIWADRGIDDGLRILEIEVIE